MFLVALLASCLAQDPPPSPLGPTIHDRVIAIEITAGAPKTEGHGGSRQVEYTSEFEGILHAWTTVSDGFDTMLRVDCGPRRYEDDDTGGKPTPYLSMRVQRGSKLLFTVFAAKPDGIGKAELHLRAAPETEATRAAVEYCKQEIAAIQQLRASGDLNAVQARASELADDIESVEGGGTSDAIEEQVVLAAVEAYAVGLLRPTDRFRRHIVTYRERMLPPDHPNLLGARSNLAINMRALGDPQGSCSLLEQVLAGYTRTLPAEHKNLQLVQLNLSVSYLESGNLVRARALLEQLVEVRSRHLPKDDERLLAARTNLATTLQESGDLAGALRIQEDVLAIQSQTLADDARSLQDSRMNLANNLHYLGDLQRARALKEKVVAVYSRTLPEQAPILQLGKLNLAATLLVLGDLQAARTLLESVLAAVATLPDSHLLVQRSRHNLAIVLRDLGELEAARHLQEQVLEAYVSSTPAPVSMLSAKHGLAMTLVQLDDAAGAHMLWEQGLDELGDLSDDHPLRLAVQEGLAFAKWSQGDLAAAGALYDRVLEVRAKALPEDHPDLQTARRNCAAHLAAECSAQSTAAASVAPLDQTKRRRFTVLAADLTRSLARAARLASLTASSREAEERCASQASLFDDALSFAAGYGVFPADPDLERSAFLLGEVMRGAALASASFARRARGSDRFAALHQDLHTASRELARLAQAGGDPEAFRATVARRDGAEQGLLALARELPGSGDAMEGLDLDAIGKRLAAREALVVYRRYLRTWHTPSLAKTDSMCAHVLRVGRKLQRIELGAIAPIEQAVQAWREQIGRPMERAVGRPAADEAKTQQATGSAVRRLVFDPLLPAIEGAEQLVVLLDDVLHAIPFDALPLEAPAAAPQLLGERYVVLQRLSLREPPPAPRPVADASTLLALGGAKFDLEPLAASAAEDAESERGPATPAAGSLGAWERVFGPLPSAEEEARGVAALAKDVFGRAVDGVVLQGRKASRDAVAQLAPKARWLHLATHGWCTSESIAAWSSLRAVDGPTHLATEFGGERMVRGLSPMLLCGLAFAGANLPADATGRYPGVISAEEIAAWDLGNCELAVLSACDTNVGTRRAGQGVASLQKALHMAGARTVVTSLWKVPDEATKDLMLDFYRRLWNLKQQEHQALWGAKLRLRNAKDGLGKPKYTLHDWAGWVLTGLPD